MREMSEMESILTQELKDIIDNIDDIEVTEEEKNEFEKEERKRKKELNKIKVYLQSANTKKEFLKALKKGLETTFKDATKDLVILEPNEKTNETDDYLLVWEGGSPYNWAVELTGQNSYFGIEGYQENDNFYLEPHRSFSLSVVEK